jgi:hypothetical protein
VASRVDRGRARAGARSVAATAGSGALRGVGAERGQGTVEWIALVVLVSLAILVTGAAVGPSLPGAELARGLASKLVCAARVAGTCERGSEELAVEYGAEVAALIRQHAPTIRYRRGTAYLPIDHRSCRAVECASVSATGAAWQTDAGLPATAFTRVLDCRAESIGRSETEGLDCSGARAGKLYIQFWFYYPDSRTDPWGDAGFHPDDWACR